MASIDSRAGCPSRSGSPVGPIRCGQVRHGGTAPTTRMPRPRDTSPAERMRRCRTSVHARPMHTAISTIIGATAVAEDLLLHVLLLQLGVLELADARTRHQLHLLPAQLQGQLVDKLIFLLDRVAQTVAVVVRQFHLRELLVEHDYVGVQLLIAFFQGGGQIDLLHARQLQLVAAARSVGLKLLGQLLLQFLFPRLELDLQALHLARARRPATASSGRAFSPQSHR